MSQVRIGGACLVPLAQRALWWPDERLLVVADLHVGKAVTFRRLGVPVPRGTTEETLARLSAAIEATGAGEVVLLGDLLHSSRSLAPGTVDAVSRWRQGRPGLRMTLVVGNHDRHAGDLPPSWQVEVAGDALRRGGLVLRHEPADDGGDYVLAGHVHPCVIVGRGADRLRLPCFHFGARVGLLPAFGAFTGMHAVRREPGDRVFVVADDDVRELPASLHSVA